MPWAEVPFLLVRFLWASKENEQDILKINNFDVHAKSSLDEWIFYLKTNKLPNNFSARGLKEVQEKLKYDQMEPAEKKRYNKFMENSLLTRSQYETALLLGREEGKTQGIEEGIEKGKAEERKERNRQIVLAGFKKGYSLVVIADIADISIEEVEQILKEA